MPQPKLPDDIAQCHAMIEAQAQLIQQLSSRVDFLVRQLFGSRSERVDPNQLVLEGIEGVAAEAPAQPPAPEEAPTAAPAKRKGHGRKRLAEDLPRKRVVHDIPEEEKVCPHGKPRVVIGEDVSEQLDYTPASYFVIEHVRPVYACSDPTCDCGVRQAEKPAQPIEKGIAGAGLLAHVITSKYCDHLPLHRQEGIMARNGVEVSRKTLCGWVMQSADVLEPVVEAMCAEVLQSRVIHTDDTPVQVQDPEKKRTTRKAYLWPYVGDPDHPYSIFDYTPTRSREGPETFVTEGTKTCCTGDWDS